MMSSQKPTLATLFSLIIFSVSSFKLSYCFGNNSINFCPEIEKQSLLSFKQSLEDRDNTLSSWNVSGEVNCCKWKGVVCNNHTGHVHQLRLQSYFLSGTLNPSLLNLKHLRYLDLSLNVFNHLNGKLNPSLLNLKHLRYLNLSQNDFNQTIPSFIGSFQGLEYLDLSNAGFYGTIPKAIGNLSSLRTLCLGCTETDRSETNHLKVDSFEWLSGLSQLEQLNMNGVDLSGVAATWVQVINTFSSLVELRFRSCSLNSIAPLNDFVNFSSLAFLDLSQNEFKSFVIPKWIFQPSELTYLDLSSSDLEGPIPSISNTTKLQEIDLFSNNLNSMIPDWLYFNKDLEYVYLYECDLHGTISSAIANLSSLNVLSLTSNELSGKIPREIANLCKLKYLYLSGNMFEGEISYSFGNMSDCFLGTLGELYLESNQLSGHVPDQFGEFKNLGYLLLGKNKLTGNLPESLGKLFNMIVLNVENNLLEGVLSESHFTNMTSLIALFLSQNNLTLKVNANWTPPFHLWGLGLGSLNLGDAGIHIPSWIKKQTDIRQLDLSCTGISGQVPSWIWRILFLNLSHNSLYGKIPPHIGHGRSGKFRQIYLSSNQFIGSLPPVIDEVIALDLSNNSFSGGTSHFFCDGTYETHEMQILNLERNQLSGELPDCLIKWPSLSVLNLGYNNMSGSIPNSMGFLAGLKSLDLHNNKFSGEIPFSIYNCTELVKIDVADNDLDGNIPTWMGTSLPNLRILILRSNKLSGKISPHICQLNSLQILDLSDNELFGIIPRCIDNFTAMATKRSLARYGSRALDYNVKRVEGLFFSSSTIIEDSATIWTKGSNLKYDTILSLVTNIDLSSNYLSGEIPKELISLVELRSLNLSGNHLTGLIPEKIGEMKQLESLDLSRNSLCGEIPSSFTGMSSLNHLNLSYNKLMGRIPESTQIRGFDASSFIGNNLCGPPLMRNCKNGDEVPGAQLNKEDDKGNKSEIDWFFVFLSLGYAVGFSVVCTTLIFKKSWRDACFGLLEDLWNKVYVYSYVKWKRCTERCVETH